MTSSCCTPDHSCSSGSAEQTVEAVGVGVTSVYAVSGMTCDHCRSTLTKVIGDLDGVSTVDVDLSAGTVTVVSAAALDDTQIADVVDDAGYAVTGRA
ncbi:heavy-metal-associated domain-containing protein [Streptomyces sp. NPDC058001]|uniref:heavy-metal-associated domain-containing protein n=1 Tax=Streptomyces sp. NPDC058001 TaxID=3346300 RepID=UPI0036E15C3A